MTVAGVCHCPSYFFAIDVVMLVQRNPLVVYQLLLYWPIIHLKMTTEKYLTQMSVFQIEL